MGIDHYPLPYGKLNYAAEDAEKIASVMREQGIADYKKEKDDWVYANKTEVILLSDKNGNSQLFPTKVNILRELESILKNVKEDDFVMIYFSGHGTGESLVTVTQDGKVEIIEVKEILAKLDSKTKEYMLFLDACRNTTNPVAPFSSKIEPGEGGFKSIFYATGKDSVSQESNKLGQGVYSYYLLEGLKGKADTDGDLIVSSDEIRNYVSEKVIAFTDNMQKPQLHQISSASKFLTRVAKPNPFRYIWKSAILPGRGQWEKGHKSNSIFFFSIALLGGFNLYSKNLTYEREEKEYYARQSLFLISSPMVLDSTDLILFQSMQSVRRDLISDSRSI
ncbi:MAG: caspase family protein [Leptospiraceae bacterium]|nr:caspase family protein [Leptospiraceae bacterium]